MTLTVEAVLQVVQVGVLTAIFFRLGRHGAKLENMEFRVRRVEEKVT